MVLPLSSVIIYIYDVNVWVKKIIVESVIGISVEFISIQLTWKEKSRQTSYFFFKEEKKKIDRIHKDSLVYGVT